MSIELDEQRRGELLAEIRRWFLDELDQEIGELKARLVLDLFLRKLAPSVYNQAVQDAQARLQDKILDLEGELHQAEERP